MRPGNTCLYNYFANNDSHELDGRRDTEKENRKVHEKAEHVTGILLMIPTGLRIAYMHVVAPASISFGSVRYWV